MVNTVMACVAQIYSKDQILGVDSPGQLVPPRVRFGMACLLISNAIGCVSCLDE
jgi:hypothetical protein